MKRKIGALSKRTRFRILQRDQFRGIYCGRSAAQEVVLHVDHVIPVSAGGSSEDGNLCAACAECNLGKGATLPPRDPCAAWDEHYDDLGQVAMCDPCFWPEPVV